MEEWYAIPWDVVERKYRMTYRAASRCCGARQLLQNVRKETSVEGLGQLFVASHVRQPTRDCYILGQQMKARLPFSIVAV